MPEAKPNFQRRLLLRQMLSASVVGMVGGLSAAPVSDYRHHPRQHDSAVRDAIRKAEDHERDYPDDVFLSNDQFVCLRQVLARLNRLQRYVGYANFNLISFDQARRYARYHDVIGSFIQRELDFIEFIFNQNARVYGFLGKKVSARLTETIRGRDVIKIRGSGHYVYRGDALSVYEKMRGLVGEKMELTSGIRSVVKQLHLFLAKTYKTAGNLSRAARSLAPPGHSFHGIGDFDVGQRGLGAANFTNAFASTDVYKRLCDLHLISMRYHYANPYGVRYEPWHIKVVSDV